MLTINVIDINSGLKKVTVEKQTSKEEKGDITTEIVKEYTYNGTRKQQKIELKLSVQYQEYLRGYKITATDADEKNNYTVVEKNDIQFQGREYTIRTESELKKFASDVNSGETLKGVSVTLENNIVIGGSNNWTPVGNSSKPFKGNFNGNGHTISNMQVLNKSDNYIGLFGYVGEEGSVENVKLSDCRITGTGTYIGGIAGYNNGTINKVCASGSITNTDTHQGLDTPIGGLIGTNGSNGTVKNSYSIVKVETVGKCIGGLIGYNWGTVETSYATGKVTGNSYLGGLIGKDGSGTVINSYWDTQTSGIDKTSSTARGIGLSTTEMKTRDSYIDWDFDNIWEWVDNNYPRLK